MKRDTIKTPFGEAYKVVRVARLNSTPLTEGEKWKLDFINDLIKRGILPRTKENTIELNHSPNS